MVLFLFKIRHSSHAPYNAFCALFCSNATLLLTAARSVLNGILKAFTRGQLLFKTIEIYDKYTLFSMFLFFEPYYSVTTQRNATVILLLPLYFKFSLSPATSFCLSALTFILIRKETLLHTATFFVLIRSVCNSTIYFLKRYVF